MVCARNILGIFFLSSLSLLGCRNPLGANSFVSTVNTVTPLILNNLATTSTAAFGLRQLNGYYLGSAIQVRRSSDSTVLNIGFTAIGDLDTQSLLAFCAAINCGVSKWYDQSGNGNNATQATAANQPMIVIGGVLQTNNGRPAINFVAGSSTFLQIATYPFSGSASVSIHAVFLNSASAGWARYFDLGNDMNVNFFATPASGSPDFRLRITLTAGAGEQGISGAPTIADASAHVLSFHHSGTTLSAYKDGTLYASQAGITIAPASAAGTANYIGKSQYPDPYLNGLMQEMVFFPALLSTADRRALELSQGQYFGITVN